MSNREQLLDLNVYGKGMESHIVVRSPIIGQWMLDNCSKSYGDVQWARVPQSIAKLPDREGNSLRLLLPEPLDPRTGSTYGRDAWDNRGGGLIEPFRRSFSGVTTANCSVFLLENLSEGIHIVMPKFYGQAKLDAYAQDIREEALWFFKQYLKPGARRVRIFIEDLRTE